MNTPSSSGQFNVNPTVSVVVSVFNGEAQLQRSLASVLQQEAIDLELIVVDDGSTDKTPLILQEVAAADRRVQVVRQENRGLTQALILGCSHARGEFIARHDADDVSLPARLGKQLALLRSSAHVSLVSCWARAIGPEDEVLYEIRRPPDPGQATEMLRGRREGPCGHGSVMFRRSDYERVGGYRRHFYFAQDTDLWLRLSEVGQLAYVPETLYAFRVATRAISSNYRSAQQALGELSHRCGQARLSGESEDALLNQAAALRPPMQGPAASDPLAGAYFIGRCLVRRGDRRARRYLWKVLEKRPWSVGAWLGVCQTFFFRRSAELGV